MSNVQEAATQLATPVFRESVRANSPGLSPVDHRRTARRSESTVAVVVDMESDHRFYTGFTENISSGGLFIATEDPMPIGAALNLTFTVPTHTRSIQVKAVVRWQRVGDSSDPFIVSGMGLAFNRLSAAEAAAIDAWIAHEETLFYDD